MTLEPKKVMGRVIFAMNLIDEWSLKWLVLHEVVVVLLLVLGIMIKMDAVAVIWKYPIRVRLNVTDALLVITWQTGNFLVLLTVGVIDL